MKINFQALGCRLNEAELDNWSQQFHGLGFQLTRDADEADLVVFNSCSVTAEADRKSRKLINRIQRNNPAGKLVVTGCYASLQTEKVRQQLGVDLVLSNEEKDNLVPRVMEAFDVSVVLPQASDNYSIFSRGRHRAFIKIQDGCRYRCTFCIVTVARGEERSRQCADILDDIRRHHQSGVQEIALTGVHVGGYGSDSGSSLYRLIAEILDKSDIPRIRLASVEPWDLPDNFFSLFTDPRLMPHMHLPLQSGCDSVLRRMSRRCKTDEFERLVDKARTEVSGFNVTTDLIAGFPGETEQEWLQTVAFVEKMNFGDMHVFSYSPRAGTKAAGLPGQVPAGVKKERVRQMIDIAGDMKNRALQSQLGNKVEVLWESAEGNVSRSGYTPNYHRITAPILFDGTHALSKVVIRDIDQTTNSLLGDPVLSDGIASVIPLK